MNSDLIKLNNELLDLVGDLLEQGLPHYEYWTVAQWYIVFALIKSYKTANSVMILCNHGNGQDAFILVRTLFELMLNTEYIFISDTDEKLELFNKFDWILRDRMITNALKNEKTSELLYEKLKDSGVNLEDIKLKAQSHKKSYKKGENPNNWSKKSIFKMAEETKLDETYKSLYELGSQFVHSNSRSITEYINVQEDGELDFQTYGSNSYTNESLIGNFECLLKILLWLNKQFNLNLEDDLNSRHEVMKKLVEEINKSN